MNEKDVIGNIVKFNRSSKINKNCMPCTLKDYMDFSSKYTSLFKELKMTKRFYSSGNEYDETRVYLANASSNNIFRIDIKVIYGLFDYISDLVFKSYNRVLYPVDLVISDKSSSIIFRFYLHGEGMNLILDISYNLDKNEIVDVVLENLIISNFDSKKLLLYISMILSDLGGVPFPVDVAEFTFVGEGSEEMISFRKDGSTVLTGLSVVSKYNGFVGSRYTLGGLAVVFVIG